MTRKPPEGSTLRPLQGVIIDQSNGWIDEPPANPPPHLLAIEQDRDFAEFHELLARYLIRPQPREPWPWWAWAIAGAAVLALILFLASFAVDAVQTAAAAAVEAKFFNAESIE